MIFKKTNYKQISGILTQNLDKYFKNWKDSVFLVKRVIYITFLFCKNWPASNPQCKHVSRLANWFSVSDRLFHPAAVPMQNIHFHGPRAAAQNKHRRDIVFLRPFLACGKKLQSNLFCIRHGPVKIKVVNLIRAKFTPFPRKRIHKSDRQFARDNKILLWTRAWHAARYFYCDK